MIIFDVETGSLPWGQLQSLIPPFDEVAAVPDAGAFDPAAVAVGNLKDPAKIDAKIATARDVHAALAASVSIRREAAHAAHVAKFVERAALSPLTGCVKAIGLLQCDDNTAAELWYTGEGYDESRIIGQFWATVAAAPDHAFVGHNIFGFDLPFLVRRSWLLGVDVPAGVRDGRYWSRQFVDTMDVWGCGGAGTGEARRPGEGDRTARQARRLHRRRLRAAVRPGRRGPREGAGLSRQ